MRSLLKTLLGVFIGLFVLSGLLTLMGAVFSLTFGVLGAMISFIWRIVSNPILLILIVAYLAYKQNLFPDVKR